MRAPVAILGQGIEEPQARAGRCSAGDLGGVQQLLSSTDTPAVEIPCLIEQLRSLSEELTVLVEAHLIGAQVEYKVVGDDLAEVRDQVSCPR